MHNNDEPGWHNHAKRRFCCIPLAQNRNWTRSLRRKWMRMRSSSSAKIWLLGNQILKKSKYNKYRNDKEDSKCWIKWRSSCVVTANTDGKMINGDDLNLSSFYYGYSHSIDDPVNIIKELKQCSPHLQKLTASGTEWSIVIRCMSEIFLLVFPFIFSNHCK